MVSISLVSAQTKTASGTVFSTEDGLPVIGASVTVKGTSQGVLTDASGKYSLSVPASANTLVISLVGMKPIEVPATPNQTINMEPDVSELSEVLVIGYGTTTRSQFVGSAKVVTGESISTKATSNVTNALQGAVAGVQVVNNS